MRRAVPRSAVRTVTGQGSCVSMERSGRCDRLAALSAKALARSPLGCRGEATSQQRHNSPVLRASRDVRRWPSGKHVWKMTFYVTATVTTDFIGNQGATSATRAPQDGSYRVKPTLHTPTSPLAQALLNTANYSRLAKGPRSALVYHLQPLPVPRYQGTTGTKRRGGCFAYQPHKLQGGFTQYHRQHCLTAIKVQITF